MIEETRVTLGIATVSLSGTLEEKLRAAAAAGFDGVEIFENDLIASPLSPRAGGARASHVHARRRRGASSEARRHRCC